MDKKKISSPAFVREAIDELKRVSWPSKKQTIYLTLVVVVISLTIGLYIGIIDILLTKFLEFITKAK